MLQKISFFSSPLIFYGANHSCEETNEEDLKEEESHSECWLTPMNTQTQNSQQNKIGLFLFWIDRANE